MKLSMITGLAVVGLGFLVWIWAPNKAKSLPDTDPKAAAGTVNAPLNEVTVTPGNSPTPPTSTHLKNETTSTSPLTSVTQKFAAEEKNAKAAGSTVLNESLFTGQVSGFPKLEEPTKQALSTVRDLVAQNKPELAIQEIEKALQTDPANQFLLLEAASMQSRLLGNEVKAEEHLRELAQKYPDSKLGSAALGDYLASHGKSKEALPYLAKAASGNDAPPDAHIQYGQNQMVQKDFEGALTTFDRAYQGVKEDLNKKAQAGESTLFTKQKLGQVAVDRGFALAEKGQFREAYEMAKEGQLLLGGQNGSAAGLLSYLEQRQRAAGVVKGE